MAPRVPPVRHYPGPMPGPYQPPAPPRREPRLVPILLIAVLGTALLGLLGYAVVARLLPGASGEESAGAPSAESTPTQAITTAAPNVHPEQRPGVGVDWGPVPPANVGAMLNAWGTLPKTLDGLRLVAKANDPTSTTPLDASYYADDGPTLAVLYADNWDWYVNTVKDLTGVAPVGAATCGERYDRPVCLMASTTGVLQVVALGNDYTKERTAAATETLYSAMAKAPSADSWGGIVPPNLAKARSLALTQLPDQIGAYVLDGEPIEYPDANRGHLAAKYLNAQGRTIYVDVWPSQLQYRHEIDPRFNETFTPQGNFACALESSLFTCVGVGQAQTLKVTVPEEGTDLAGAAQTAQEIYDHI